ncbi:MAG: hypothetical protein OHK93_007205 [Ramalina farinacea]|uniref:HD/PDEase domain-containing protein n=1 Tax=Ramalina farinacea TaxID=258253 RepID=A0AA43QMX5_9LECA|nr:hypothetical protein [Ramalina farinacea]
MCPPSSLPLSSTNPGTSAPEDPPPDLVPSIPLCLSAYDHVHQNLPAPIFNHSVRVYLYVKSLAERAQSPWATQDRLRILFTACLFHDMGASNSANDSPERFEVCGADACAEHLHAHSVTDAADVHEAWVAIALHTSPGIAERISPLARWVRLAALADFDGLRSVNPSITGSEQELLEDEVFREGIEKRFPRLDPEKALGDAVTEQGLRQPKKAPPASWAGIMVRAHQEDPEWEGVNKAF